MSNEKNVRRALSCRDITDLLKQGKSLIVNKQWVAGDTDGIFKDHSENGFFKCKKHPEEEEGIELEFLQKLTTADFYPDWHRYNIDGDGYSIKKTSFSKVSCFFPQPLNLESGFSRAIEVDDSTARCTKTIVSGLG